jgi:tRNA (guanine-N7-)-methyltransferase
MTKGLTPTDIELDPLIVWTKVKWRQIFRRVGPIKVEIGFGNGAFLVEMAQREPETNFVGLEIYRKGIKKAKKRIKRAGLENIRLIRHEASAALSKIFSGGDISEIYINFPDPWPKRRHHKRRLINSSFIDTVYHVLKDGGRIFIATDYQEYAEEIEGLFKSHEGYGYLNHYFPEHTPTKYEQETLRVGQAVYYISWEKITSP